MIGSKYRGLCTTFYLSATNKINSLCENIIPHFDLFSKKASAYLRCRVYDSPLKVKKKKKTVS